MKILLVFSGSQVPGWGSARPGGSLDANFLPHGINSIGSSLLRAGHEVFPLDFRSCAGWGKVIQTLSSDKWDRILVGCLSAEFNNTREFIRLCKEHTPLIPIVLGGIHVTVSDTRELDGVTSIVHGEADTQILWIVKDLYPITKCPPVQFLDDLPTERRDLFSPYESQTKFLPLLDTPFSSFLFGRGCPYLCSFCYRSSQEPSFNKCRTRSPENCIDEIIAEDTRLNGLKSFMVHDDLFNPSKTWVEKFILHWSTRIGKRIRFWCQMRADQIIRFKDLMPDLARIGLTWVSLGMESMHQPTLDFIGKGCTVEENWEAIRICKENKINLFLNYIRHLPNETEESVVATVGALKIIKPEYHAASTYTDMPGTVMNKYCRDNGLVTDEHYSLTRYPYEPKLKGIDYEGPIHQLWESALGYKESVQNWEDFH